MKRAVYKLLLTRRITLVFLARMQQNLAGLLIYFYIVVRVLISVEKKQLYWNHWKVVKASHG